MGETVLTHLSKKLQEEMKVYEQETVLGKVKTFEDYKFSCGVYRGLAIANGIRSRRLPPSPLTSIGVISSDSPSISACA